MVSPNAVMRARNSYFVGIMIAVGILAGPAASEGVKSSASTYRPWTKFCFEGTCFIGADIFIGCKPGFAAVLTERADETKKTLRITVPDSVNRGRGARVFIDQDEPTEQRYGRCAASFCSADIEGGAELVARLKRGRKLTVDTIGANGPMHFELSLTDFAAAYDGPSMEPKVFDSSEKQKSQELQKPQCETN